MVTPSDWNPERADPDTLPGRSLERVWVTTVFIIVAIVSFIMRAALM